MPIASRVAGSQASVRRSISIVRLALVTSVTWTPPFGPPVRFQITHVSGVPKSRSPASARARAPGTLSRIQRILGPEKYVASGSPQEARKRSPPRSLAAAQPRISVSVRVSCHTIAFATALPVRRSQQIAGSRWFVTPTAARSAAVSPA